MSVTATGIVGLALTKLVEHISESTTFQTACGVGTAAAALPHIYWPWAVFNEVSRPFAIVSPTKELSQNRVSGGASTLLLPVGALNLMLAIDNDSNYDEQDNWIIADNFFSGVLFDIQSISGISDNLNITSIDVAQEQAISSPTTVVNESQEFQANPKFWLIGYSVKWGAI